MEGGGKGWRDGNFEEEGIRNRGWRESPKCGSAIFTHVRYTLSQRRKEARVITKMLLNSKININISWSYTMSVVNP